MFKAEDVVYISGPMTGKKFWNYPRFHGVEMALRHEFGCKVLNPAREEAGLTWEAYMEIDRAKVKVCTHVLMLSGWEKSKGARLEKDWAEEWGKIVVFEYELTV